MPLEDLLAFYGYESTIPAVANSSANSSPSELADELPDMTLDKVSMGPYGSFRVTVIAWFLRFLMLKACSNSEINI